ncbi:sigma 54-interacting transcriptional regulator [Hungatella sp.]
MFSGEKMRKLVSQAKIAAQHASNVLITGESGTT